MSLKSNSASYLSRAKRLLFFTFATTPLVPVLIYLSKASAPAVPNYGSQTSTSTQPCKLHVQLEKGDLGAVDVKATEG